MATWVASCAIFGTNTKINIATHKIHFCMQHRLNLSENNGMIPP
jgi:hypothetical protein